jgi:hypothetical protein
MDNYTASWNNDPNGYQSEDGDEDVNDGPGDAPPGPNVIGGIPKGEPSETDKEPSVNMDEDTPDKFSSSTGEEDTEFSTNNDNCQIEGPLRKILGTDNLSQKMDTF